MGVTAAAPALGVDTWAASLGARAPSSASAMPRAKITGSISVRRIALSPLLSNRSRRLLQSFRVVDDGAIAIGRDEVELIVPGIGIERPRLKAASWPEAQSSL